MSALVNLVAFLFVIGILVTVHEFGHFWVARRCGIAVQRFSLGFGRVLLRRQGRDGVEYALSAVPLGGYVKMLDEREGEVPEALRHRAFNRKPLWQRNAVIVAGPAFNFAFAILVFWVLFLMGDTVLRPVLDEVPADTPAAEAGFRAGDEIIGIGGHEVTGWNDVMKGLLARGMGNSALSVTVRTVSGDTVTRQLDVTAIGPIGEREDVMGALGWRPKRPPLAPAIAEVESGSAAADAGLRPGDEVVAIGDEPITRWQELVDGINAHRNGPLTLTIERDRERRSITVDVPGEGPIGVRAEPPDRETLRKYQRELDYGPVSALGRAVTETWDQGRLMVTVAAKMVTGEASTRNLSGPIHIAEYAGTSASLGVVPFLNLLAIISISLGIINLFPIPVLDGGQLLFNGCEWVMGRPLSESAQAVGTQIGLVLIVMLMGLAFYNDLLRALGAG